MGNPGDPALEEVVIEVPVAMKGFQFSFRMTDNLETLSKQISIKGFLWPRSLF